MFVLSDDQALSAALVQCGVAVPTTVMNKIEEDREIKKRMRERSIYLHGPALGLVR
jgi:hypothetical protein